MKNEKFQKLLFCFLFLIIPFSIKAKTWKVNSDYYPATDKPVKETLAKSEEGTAVSKANVSAEVKTAGDPKDILRPIFHIMPKDHLIGDPNGPVYYDGEYHLFFQYLPYWGELDKPQIPNWGHVVSKDMVHWKRLPIALSPDSGSYDRGAVASGCCVVHDGTPTIIYTGMGSVQAQCIATSSDHLRTWQKYKSNPVIPTPPPIEGLDGGFRDPFAWREGDEWRLLIGSGYAKSLGGMVLLYRSKDLKNWDYLGPLCSGMGEHCFQWECPTFFPLGDKHVLIVSPLYREVKGLRGPVQYSVGTYRNNRFEQGEWKPVDLGGGTAYYASTTFADQKNRRILWGFVMAGPPPGADWYNCISLPRVVTLGKDSSLNSSPLPELKLLRKDEHQFKNLTLKQDKEIILDKTLGLHGEIDIEIQMGTADKVELRIGRTSDGENYVPVSYDKTTGVIVLGDKKAEFKLDADNRLRIHFFIDGIVAEMFVNEKVCFSNAIPVTEKSAGLSVISLGGNASVTKGSLWKMTSIWSQ